jgi:hypothetical protein
LRHNFMTSSVPLGSFLELKLMTVAMVDFDPSGRRPVILLEDSERLRHLVQEYFAGAEVPAKKMADGSAALRARFDRLFDNRRALRLSPNSSDR